MAHERRQALVVYLALVALTALTVASAAAGAEAGRTILLTWALAIAGTKAVLIALYYMHLLDEPGTTWGVVAAGAAAVLVLLVGLLPDVALRL